MSLDFTTPIKKIESPKVFISYAWGTEEYQKRVLNLAVKMTQDGIDVILDKWDLKEGNNSYAFMEYCINDESVTNILMLIDPLYAKKANAREGGVGTETLIISPEIYSHADQSRFIPVLMQKDTDGKTIVPNYLKGVIYFDLSDTRGNEKEYRRLVNRLYGEVVVKKPPKGRKPDWVGKSDEIGRLVSKKSEIEIGSLFHRPSEQVNSKSLRATDTRRNYNIGDIVPFGRYPQEADGTIKPIEWRVLDIKPNGSALLISKYALDNKPYNKEWTAITWATCTLRKWLNFDFYNEAFDSSEQSRIAFSNVPADRNPKYSTDPGRDTVDKVFLLSLSEAERYFADEKDCMCIPNLYAASLRGYVSEKFRLDGTSTVWWWLRSPGNDVNRAANVYSDGSLSVNGCIVHRDYPWVRPALWINP